MRPFLVLITRLCRTITFDRERATCFRIAWPAVLNQHDLSFSRSSWFRSEHAVGAIVNARLHRSPDYARHKHLLIEMAKTRSINPSFRLYSFTAAEITGRDFQRIKGQEGFESPFADSRVLQGNHPNPLCGRQLRQQSSFR